MTSREFCYWLQGYFEIQKAEGVPSNLTPAQTDMIKNHLNLVFKHEIDPSYSSDPKVQQQMNEIHSGGLQVGGKDSEGNLMRC